nr:uncharacterized protein LOC108944362 isoform X1 [Nicotiana tomentosiformis]
MILRHGYFRIRSREAPDRRLAFLRKLTIVRNYIALASILESTFGLQQMNSAHKMFGKKPDRKTDNVVDDKTTIPTADATKAEGEDEDTAVQVKTDDGTEVLQTQAKEKMGSSGLDDNEEDFLPPVIVVGDTRSPRDTSQRYVIATSLGCGSSKQKIEIVSFEDMCLANIFMEPETIEDLCLDKFFMENVDSIPTSDKTSDEIMSDVEHGKSMMGFSDRHILSRCPFDPGANFFIVTIPITARDHCVWDPGISSEFRALAGSTENMEAHKLLEETRKRSCLFANLYAWEHVCGVDRGVECSCNFRNSPASYKLLSESIALPFPCSFNCDPTHIEEQYIIDQFRNLQSGKALELSMLYPDMTSKLVICVNELVATALVKMYTNNAQLDNDEMLFSKTVHEDEIIAIHAPFCIWSNTHQRQKGVIMDLIQFISPKELGRAIISEHESTGSSLLSLNFWKIRFIHAPTIWSRYLLDIHQVPLILSGTIYNNVMFGKCYEPKILSKAMQNSFLSSNRYLSMMESTMIFCAQRALFKNSISNLLVRATNALTSKRIVQEAQVKCDSLNAKIKACCLMIYGDIVPKVVNAIVATISCRVDIEHIFSLYSPEHLWVETIGGVRAINISLDANLEDKVLFEDGSIVVNQPYLISYYGPEMRNVANQVGNIGPRAKGPMIEQPNRILVRYIWDPGGDRGRARC